ncbi:hypothetical protein [Paenibacillus sp. ACRRY]|uniref:hypothetical protein n=1 Tax=Paenibacillus sp. ACRRY TaxID=2918208 RepID=UPI001EF5A6E4|nr:hypothetical protein [Paenibacillus sp. ACRRY]MCG7385076.1 hypothetical protein [Paenibacillus sp. ACRRY]
MRMETSAMAEAHMEYLKSDPAHAAEMRTYDTVAEHFYHYLVNVQRLLPDTARGIVDDFQADLERQ